MADLWTLGRYLVALWMLLGASRLDWESRRVPNPYWFPYVAIAILAVFADVLQLPWPDLGVTYLFSAVFAGLFYLFWRLGLFGGADAKGLMLLAFLAPVNPVRLEFPGYHAPLVFDAVVDGCIALVLLPAVLAAWNVVRGHAVFPAALVGYPMPLATARERHVWPMHRVTPEGRVLWRYWQRPGQGIEETYDALAKAGLTEVWVTPKIPFLIPVTVGWIFAAPFGNVVLQIALRYLGR